MKLLQKNSHKKFSKVFRSELARGKRIKIIFDLKNYFFCFFLVLFFYCGNHVFAESLKHPSFSLAEKVSNGYQAENYIIWIELNKLQHRINLLIFSLFLFPFHAILLPMLAYYFYNKKNRSNPEESLEAYERFHKHILKISQNMENANGETK